MFTSSSAIKKIKRAGGGGEEEGVNPPESRVRFSHWEGQVSQSYQGLPRHPVAPKCG